MSEDERPSDDPEPTQLDSEDLLGKSDDTTRASGEEPNDSPNVKRLGDFELLRELGRGGMGEVYVAQQEKPIRRRVALKLIKLGMDTKQVVARFESERQALALMDHPYIAKVFDAGSTPEGRPYFTMEYVKGEPVSRYCDRHRLTTRERLELFMRVCEGVQHAHQKGIIHRDIKPSNVLVAIQDDKPVPKIIDFGVAKATEQRLTEQTVYTQLGVLIGTPEYMSPEQAEMTGLDVDTRTDVYSLGVLLYELLTGVLPFDPAELRKAGFDEIRRRIREEEPSRPSTRLSTLSRAQATSLSTTRRADLPALHKQLKSDLDWITMKALEKDRTRRYGSPQELAADIERHLTNQPVLASPPSTVYRTRKFVRRHRLGVGMALLGALVLLAFAGTMAVQTTRIARERDRVSQARDDVERARDDLESVVEFQSSMLSEVDTEGVGWRLLADLRERVAEARSGATEREIEEAVASFDAAVRGVNLTDAALHVIYEEILERAGDAIEQRFVEQPLIGARLLDTIGSTYLDLGLYERAAPHLESALETRERFLGRDDPDTLASINSVGLLLHALGRLDEAEDHLRVALEGRRLALGSDHEDTFVSLNNMGFLLHDLGRLDEAEAYYREALEGYRRVLGDDHPETLTGLGNLGLVNQDRGDLEEAERYAREVLEGQRRVLGNDHSQTLVSISNLGSVLQAKGQLKEAERFKREAVEGLRRTLGNDHFSTLIAINNLGFLLKTQGKLEEAGPFFREALEGFRRQLGGEHRQTLNAMANLGDLYTDLGRYDEAEERLVTAAEAAPRSLGREQVTTGLIIRKYGRCLTMLKRYREAETALLEAHSILTQLVGPEHIQTERVVRNLGELYDAWGKPRKAAEWQGKLPLESKSE